MTAFLIALLVAAPPPAAFTVLESKPDAALNARFANTEGWIGGDDSYSLLLPDGRRLWLYADTWVGKIKDGKRTDATMVNNTLALQTGDRVDYFVRKDGQGKPVAAFVPPTGEAGWFWSFGGLFADGKLHLFLGQIVRTDEKSVWGFRGVGMWLATIANWQEPPERWKPEYRKLPFTTFEPKKERSFGSAALVHDGWAYIFGFVQEAGGFGMKRSQLVARVRPTDMADFARWEFHGQGGWQKEAEKAEPLFAGASTECSVVPMPRHGGFALVYTENGLSDRIVARTAARPEGPWSAPILLHRCPEMAKDKKLFTYAAKAHAGLAGADELAVTYVVNSNDFWQVAKDATLYWPQFVRVKLAPAK